jgi:hypothetical protein
VREATHWLSILCDVWVCDTFERCLIIVYRRSLIYTLSWMDAVPSKLQAAFQCATSLPGHMTLLECRYCRRLRVFPRTTRLPRNSFCIHISVPVRSSFVRAGLKCSSYHAALPLNVLDCSKGVEVRPAMAPPRVCPVQKLPNFRPFICSFPYSSYCG